MEQGEAWGAIVHSNDPYIPVVRETREYPMYAGRRSVTISNGYDLILVATPHDEYKSIDFTRLGIPVVDTRNIGTGNSALITKA